MLKMTGRMLIAGLFGIVGASSSYGAVNGECVAYIQRPEEAQCSSSGYWSGKNFSRCEILYQVRARDGETEVRTYTGYGSATTDTGLFALMTFGLTDALANQANALSARNEAMQNVIQQYRILNLQRCPTPGSGFEKEPDDSVGESVRENNFSNDR